MCGEKIELKEMTLDDVRSFRSWSRHEDELFFDYDFVAETEEELADWYRWKTGSIFSRYYTIFADGIPVGYLGMKQINRLFGSASLGIVLDPGKLNRGYGGEAIRQFLKIYFEDQRMRRLYLQVAPYNKRGIHLYKKLGFRITGTFPFIYPNGKPPFEREEMKGVKDTALFFAGNWILRGLRMELKREDYRKGEEN